MCEFYLQVYVRVLLASSLESFPGNSTGMRRTVSGPRNQDGGPHTEAAILNWRRNKTNVNWLIKRTFVFLFINDTKYMNRAQTYATHQHIYSRWSMSIIELTIITPINFLHHYWSHSYFSTYRVGQKNVQFFIDDFSRTVQDGIMKKSPYWSSLNFLSNDVRFYAFVSHRNGRKGLSKKNWSSKKVFGFICNIPVFV